MRNVLYRYFLGFGGLCWGLLLAYLLLLAWRLFPFAPSGERVAPYFQFFRWSFILPGLFASCVFFWVLKKYSWEKENGVAALWGWLGASLLFHAVLAQSGVFPMSEIVQSVSANSFYAAAGTAPGRLLRHSLDLPALFPAAQHIHTNMLGKPLLYALLGGLSRNPLFLACVLVALAKLAAVPLYFLVRAMTEDRRKALLSALFYLFAPPLLYFAPVLNTVTPLLLLTALLPVILYFRTGKPLLAAAAGALFYLLLFFEPAPGAVFCIFTGLSALYYARIRQDTGYRQLFSFLIFAAAGFAACYLLLYAVYGYCLLENMKQAYVYAKVPFYRREYWRWFTLNPPLFLVNCGIGVFVAALLAGIRAPRRLLGGEPVFMEAAAVFTLAASLLFFNALGIAGAEGTRLWLYLSPFAAMAAAGYCVEKGGLAPAWTVLAVAAVQAAATLPLAGFVIPWDKMVN